MGLSVSQSNSSYSRVLTKQSKYSGRLTIQKSQRFKPFEIKPQNILSNCENQGNTSNRSICFPIEPSVTKIHVLASPGSCAVDSLQRSWRNFHGYAFPPFCLIGKVLAKVRKDQYLLLIITPVWQTQSWYATSLSISAQHPIILPNLTTLLQDPQGQKHPL